MDPQRFKEAYERLQHLDDRMTYRVRPRTAGMGHLTLEQIEQRHRDLANYVIEVKEVVEELFRAIAGKPGDAKPAG